MEGVSQKQFIAGSFASEQLEGRPELEKSVKLDSSLRPCDTRTCDARTSRDRGAFAVSEVSNAIFLIAMSVGCIYAQIPKKLTLHTG